MDDLDQIRDLMARYAHYYDTGRAEEWAGLFTEDGSITIGDAPPTAGRDALLAMAAAVVPRSRHHFIVNEAIDVDGDRARGESSLLLSQGQPPTFVMAGRYDDELVKVAGQWLFRSRRVTLDG
ncbi:MAG TPA: nuclear transport factor 2 family protein [Acidimicrobiales bacterium]|nr:nuclear transport factor 2 family protein [Acidimicrobiales bacterium]